MVNYKTHVLLLSECVRPNEASWLFFLLAIPNMSIAVYQWHLDVGVNTINIISLQCNIIYFIMHICANKFYDMFGIASKKNNQDASFGLTHSESNKTWVL
jgi:hypothetical protein